MSRISILSQIDRLELENGMELRLVSAWEVMSIRQEAEELSGGEEHYPLCLNACLLARALESGGEPVFSSGSSVLEGLTGEEISTLTKLWSQFNQSVNPSPSGNPEMVERLKKNSVKMG